MSYSPVAGRRVAWLALCAVLLPGLAACGDQTAPTAVAPVTATLAAATATVPPAATALPPTMPATVAPPTVAATATAESPTLAPTAAPDLSTATAVTPLATVTSVPVAATALPATDTPVPAAVTATPAVTAAATATVAADPSLPPTVVPVGAGGIVFVQRGATPGLAVVQPDGSGLRLLLPGAGLSGPRWSPDRSHIAYLRGSGPQADLWVVPADGNGARQLTNTPGVGESDVRWSPDGTTLAYARSSDRNRDGQLDTGDPSEVWLIAADGSNARRLADGRDPAWAPDGKRLAFATNGTATDRDPNGAPNTIDMINAQGQNRWSPIKIPNIPQDTSVLEPQAQFNAGTTFLRYPTWAPNNGAVALMAQGHSGLIVTTTDKGANATLRDFQYEGGFERVFWSPDGAKLLYETSPPSGYSGVTVLTLADRHRLMVGGRPNGSAYTPAWAPDSRRFVWVQPGGNSAVSADPAAHPAGALLVSSLTTGAAPTTILGANAADPDWR